MVGKARMVDGPNFPFALRSSLFPVLPLRYQPLLFGLHIGGTVHPQILGRDFRREDTYALINRQPRHLWLTITERK